MSCKSRRAQRPARDSESGSRPTSVPMNDGRDKLCIRPYYLSLNFSLLEGRERPRVTPSLK